MHTHTKVTCLQKYHITIFEKEKEKRLSILAPHTLISSSALVSTHCRLFRELDHTKHVEKDN